MDKMVTDDAFLTEMLAQSPSANAFRPTIYYDLEGDCIEFVAKSGHFYAERIDDLLTVYRAMDTHEIMGGLIKGVKGLIQQFGTKVKVLIPNANFPLTNVIHSLTIERVSEVSETTRAYEQLQHLAQVSDARVTFQGVCAQ